MVQDQEPTEAPIFYWLKCQICFPRLTSTFSACRLLLCASRELWLWKAGTLMVSLRRGRLPLLDVCAEYMSLSLTALFPGPLYLTLPYCLFNSMHLLHKASLTTSAISLSKSYRCYPLTQLPNYPITMGSHTIQQLGLYTLCSFLGLWCFSRVSPAGCGLFYFSDYPFTLFFNASPHVGMYSVNIPKT